MQSRHSLSLDCSDLRDLREVVCTALVCLCDCKNGGLGEEMGFKLILRLDVSEVC